MTIKHLSIYVKDEDKLKKALADGYKIKVYIGYVYDSEYDVGYCDTDIRAVMIKDEKT